jgi:predicted RNase H-like HicB family nuclease
MMHKYEIILYWSQEDQCYVVEVPELPGCMAHGQTQPAALRQANEAVQLWLETARQFGDPIPVPKGRLRFYAEPWEGKLDHGINHAYAGSR